MRGPPKNKKRRQGRPQARRPSRPPRQATPPPGTGVVVNGYSDGWLQKGFPWVYREEITAQTPGLAPGAVATIYNEQHAVRGVGVFDAAKVAVRRFREDAGPLDQASLHRSESELPRDFLSRWCTRPVSTSRKPRSR